jgi:outer membrane protein OmpA-like peptidoglycan-associated protein
MKFTLIAGVLAALVAVPLAHADDPAKAQHKDPMMDRSNDQTSDPTDAKALQPVDIKFDTDSAQIKSDADSDIAAAVDWAKCNPKAALIIEGHADPRGPQDHNLVLSAARAATVRQKLVDQGVRSDRIVITVFGENGPQRATYAEDRRVTVRPADVPVDAREVQAMR